MAKFPIETHEFFNAYRKAFGIVRMIKLFGVSQTSIYRWCADPDTNGETRPNPLDKLDIMFEDFTDAGEQETAERFADRIARRVGGELCFRNVNPDRDSFLEETLDTNEAVAKFHLKGQALLKSSKGSIEEVRAAKKIAHKQLDEEFKALTIELENK